MLTIDQKPKSGDPRKLKRLQNIGRNPKAALVADHYDDDDWAQLRWLMVKGTAEILEDGHEHDQAQDRLRARYPQYRRMELADLPFIAIRIEQWPRRGITARVQFVLDTEPVQPGNPLGQSERRHYLCECRRVCVTHAFSLSRSQRLRSTPQR